jgi:hypothetical protein
VGAVEVAADRWEGDAEQLRLTGQVQLAVAGDVLVAEAASLDLAAGLASLSAGRWVRPDGGSLAFDAATVRWDPVISAEALGAAFVGSVGGRVLSIRGERLGWSEGALAGTGVAVAPCACERPPWSITAAALTYDAGALAWRGARLAVFGRPLIPLPPARIPLVRRSGVLAPAVVVADDGLRVAVPLYLVVGPSADVTLTPELRTGRGARALGEARYALRGGTGQLDGAFGWDASVGAWRGAGAWRHAAEAGDTAARVDAQVLGDPLYLEDYTDPLLTRATPWVASRGWARAGPAEVWADATTGADATQRVGAALRAPAWTGAGGTARADLVALGTAPTVAGSRAPADAGAWWAGRASWTRPIWWGPLRAVPTGAVALAGAAGASAPPGGWAETGVTVGTPLWRDTRRGRAVIEPLWVARAGVAAGAPPAWTGLGAAEGSVPVALGVAPVGASIGEDPALAAPIAAPVAATGPELRLRLGGSEARLGGRWTLAGPSAFGSLGGALGPWSSWGQADWTPTAALAAGGLGWTASTGRWAARVGGLWASAADASVPVAWGVPAALGGAPGADAPAPVSAVSAGVDLTLGLRWSAEAWADPAAGRLRMLTLGARWTHPARCLGADLGVRIEPDVPIPVVRLGVDWAPAASGDGRRP